MQTRINKYISETGFCSRREADKFIEEGRVTVNGEKPELGTKVSSLDEIRIDGKLIESKREAVYIAFHKPPGLTSTTDLKDKFNLIDYINFPERIFPIGRLDKDSEGLIFLTNDGDIVNKILRAGNKHEKEYIVTVEYPITAEFISAMGMGVPILDTVTQKCFVEQNSLYVFRIILTQGLNRQIRRMCAALGNDVKQLKRIRIMNVTLTGIPKGEWRYLSKDEIAHINHSIIDSSNTEEASKLAGG